MKIKLILTIFTFLLTMQIKATSLASIYSKGSGQIYKMTSVGYPDSTVTIYNAKVTDDKLWVEFYIESGLGIIQSGLWQQFVFKKIKNGSLSLVNGYIKTKEMSYPEELPAKHLKGSDSLNMSQFLFKELAEIKKFQIGKEEVTVPAGTVMSNHYQIKGKGQTIDFWIAEESSKPLIMVKLISKGKKKADNYNLELITLAKNVKANIDSKNARPLSEKMRKTLEETPLN